MVVVFLLAAAAAAAEPTNSVTVDVGGPVLIGVLLNTYGTFVEAQTRVSPRFSVIGEVTYLASPDFRALGGSSTGLEVRLGILCGGAAFWFRRPFDGPFVSVRAEGWLAAAEDRSHTVAVGNAFDVNLQPGWQWDLDGFTLIASVSAAYVTGPIRSHDGTVEFPLHGFSATPHLRLGRVW